MDAEISLVLNGKSRTITTDPERPLLEVLREDLHLTEPNTVAARANAAPAQY